MRLLEVVFISACDQVSRQEVFPHVQYMFLTSGLLLELEDACYKNHIVDGGEGCNTFIYAHMKGETFPQQIQFGSRTVV